MNMKNKTLFAVVAVSSAFLAGGCGGQDNSVKEAEAEAAAPVVEEASAEALAAAPAPSFADDEIIVEAYGDKLTYGKAIEIMTRMLKMQGAPAEQIDQIVKQMAGQAVPEIAEQFVQTAALKEAAAKAGFKATKADVDEAISNMVSRLPPGRTFEDMMAGIGMTRADVEKEISEGLPIQKFFESLTKDVKVDEAKAKAFYDENGSLFEEPEQIRASHILVATENATNDVLKAAAKAKIEGILKQVKEGGDFAALAKANSDCPSKNSGGDLGLFGKGQMVPAFEAAAFALSTNEVSGIVETPFGYHIIKLTERAPASKKAFDEVKEQIIKRVESDEQGKIVSAYVEKLFEGLKYKANEKIQLFVKEEVAPEAEVLAPAADAEAAAPAPEAK